MTRAIVIGGGISGIASAARLTASGFRTCILESDDVVGGRIGARGAGESEVDLGGRNFSERDVHLAQLLGELGISEFSPYRISSVSVGGARSFDMRTGGSAWVRLKRALGNSVSANPVDLLRLRAVVRGALREQESGLVGGGYWARLAEQTRDPVAASYFGRAVAEAVLRPWTLRMMAAEPDEVYLGNLGPLLGRSPGPLRRVRAGMGAVMRAVRDRFDVRLGHAARRVTIRDGVVTGVEGVTANGANFHERASVVVVATPATIAAQLVSAIEPIARELRSVVYRPVATVVAAYSDVRFPHGAGGLFLPRGYPLSHVARYDESNRVRFSFAGVAARRAIAASSVEQLAAIGEAAFAEFGGRLGRREALTGAMWHPGLCGQTWMHHRTLQALASSVAAVRGLALTGDYVRGNSLEACVVAAEESVARLVRAEAVEASVEVEAQDFVGRRRSDAGAVPDA